LPKFILVDHSLRDTGGHHYPYAVSVLQAAASAGFAPALATHRDFSARAAFPSHWPLHALFPAVSYSPHTLDTQTAAPASRGLPGRVAASWHSLWRQRGRARHIRQFAAACHELFRRLPLAAGDIVFFPTASELDLLGLGLFLANAQQPAVRCCTSVSTASPSGVATAPRARRPPCANRCANRCVFVVESG
jgi:hypothetical protein